MFNKVLITGASGFLGSIISKHLCAKQIILFNKKTNGIPENEIVGDLVNDIDLSIHEYFEVVIHCAGKVHKEPKSAEEKAEFYSINTQGTINLLRALDKNNIRPKAFVFISTVAVYGLSSGLNIDENTALNANDPYGHSKILAEEAIQEWGIKNKVVVSVLRLPIIVGEKPLGNLASMMNAIKLGYYFGIGEGGAKKSMVLATDVVMAIQQVALIGGVFNLTDGYHPNFRELECVMAKHLKVSQPIIISNKLALIFGFLGSTVNWIINAKKSPFNKQTLNKMTKSLTFSDEKAKKVFDWKPNKVLEFYT